MNYEQGLTNVDLRSDAHKEITSRFVMAFGVFFDLGIVILDTVRRNS